MKTLKLPKKKHRQTPIVRGSAAQMATDTAGKGKGTLFGEGRGEKGADKADGQRGSTAAAGLLDR